MADVLSLQMLDAADSVAFCLSWVSCKSDQSCRSDQSGPRPIEPIV
jgi:hypothetical protein